MMIQIYNVKARLQKTWKFKGRDEKVLVTFVELPNFEPAVAVENYINGVKTDEKLIDENCDVYEPLVRGVSKDEGNGYYKWLRKRGFEVVTK